MRLDMCLPHTFYPSRTVMSYCQTLGYDLPVSYAFSAAKPFSTGLTESTLYSVTFDCFPSSWTIPSYMGGYDGAACERRLPIVYANQRSPASTSTPTAMPTPTPALAPVLRLLVEEDAVVSAGPVN